MLIPYKEKHRVTPVFADCCRQMLLMLTPFAPHISEEIWNVIGGDFSVHLQDWIGYNKEWTKEDTIEIAVQKWVKFATDLQFLLIWRKKK